MKINLSYLNIVLACELNETSTRLLQINVKA